MSLWELLERAAAGGSGELVEPGARVGYPELLERARRMAGFLQSRGVRPGDRVALLEDNTLGFLAATYAAAACGAVLTPLGTRLAATELAGVLRDAQARVLVAGVRLAPLVRALVAERAPLTDLLWLAGADGAVAARGGSSQHERSEADLEPSLAAALDPCPGGADDLAQLYFTSGSTGRPKGVQLTQRNVLCHSEAVIAELSLHAEDRWGHFAPMFHLADAWAIFAVTAVGGTHVTLPVFDAGRALEAIERWRVGLSNLVPTMLVRMLDHPEAERRDLSSLRLLLSGGAPIAMDTVRRIARTFRCEYAQTYGMTETSPYLTINLLEERQRELPLEERIRLQARTGRPFRGVELEVVDAGGACVPHDGRTVGEIRARGPTVSPGYWRRPEETAAAFRDGWLATGDLAVVDPDGVLRIVDRKKDMILTGGENVYCVEVEQALCAHPDVREAAVFGRPHPEWGEVVSAAVVLREGAATDEAGLREFAHRRLAGFKVPKQVEIRKDLPRLDSGKVDKRALRGPGDGPGAP